MKLDIHPKAKNKSNEKAEFLFSLLKPAPFQHLHKDRYKPDLHVKHSIEKKDILGEIIFGYYDLGGDEISRFFEFEDKLVGLTEQNFKDFLILCEDIQKRKELRDHISNEFVRKILFDWMVRKYKGKTKLSAIDFLLQQAKNQIRNYEIWIPIAQTYIEEEIKIGHVIFKELSGKIIDKWYQNALKKNDSKVPLGDIEKYFEQDIRKLQGRAIGIVNAFAEPIRAAEIAFFKVEQSLNLLRFFVPANFHPKLFSHTNVLGKHNQQTQEFLIVNNNQIESSPKRILNPSSLIWFLKKEQIKQFEDAISIFDKLILLKEKTEFQTYLLKSLSYYSKSSLMRTYSDKLVYILVALESILLKNINEPIQQNIGERVAFTISDNWKERKKIVQNVKEVYEIRSRYIHHGYELSVNNLDVFKYFLRNSWELFRIMIANFDSFETKSDMIDKIEERKFSG